jgi:hypothetical protein
MLRLRVLVLILLSCSPALAHAESFVTAEQYFSEALSHPKEWPLKLLYGSVTAGSSLAEFTNGEITAFTSKVKAQAAPGESFQLKAVHFSSAGGDLYSCLGAIIKFPMKGDDPFLLQYADRSGIVYYGDCRSGSGAAQKAIPGFFTYYQIFPLDQSLPISSEDIASEYQIYRQMYLNPHRRMDCRDIETNLFGEPRSAAEIYEIGDHFVVRMVTTSSSADAADARPDLPVDLGFLDLGMLERAKENIEFLLKMKGVVLVAFKKSQCRTFGDEQGLPSLVCVADVADPSHHYSVSEVQFVMTTQEIRSLDFATVSQTPAVLTSLEHSFDLSLRVRAHDGLPANEFKMVLGYKNTPGSPAMCL